MKSYLLVAIGSALGGVARFWLSALFAQRLGDAFPWGTIVVNVTGCFLIGLADGWMRADGHPALGTGGRQLLMMGLLGGYTTFSSFGLQTLHLIDNGRWLGAAGNVTLSVAACLVAVWLGQLCAQCLSRQP
jgi:fluoride exporter